MAQSVERRIGSAEVTGPIPVTSFLKVQYLLDFLFYHKKLLVCSGKTTRIYKAEFTKEILVSLLAGANFFMLHIIRIMQCNIHIIQRVSLK